MFRSKCNVAIYLVFVSVILIVGNLTASTGSAIGEKPLGNSVLSINSQALSQVVNEYGQISLSIDAIGTLSTTGTIKVEKPLGGTVRKAFLLSATTGYRQVRLNTGDVKLQGNSVVWNREIPSSIASYNYWADVTNIVKPVVDAALPGLVNLTITEANTLDIDGEILVVIFNDPNQATNNTILLYFGAQNVDGDTFVIELGTPIDKSDPNLVLDFSLGISFGYQTSSVTHQYSTVDVNGVRLTTSAGGQDDGANGNGALITVGGIGDNNSNPANPYALPTHARSDDELYDLKPFANSGDTSITIDTHNPSADDNVFFAALFLGATRNVGIIDVDITLYNNPTTSAARAPYDNIINYFADGVYEASNGAHKLGRVTFHPLGANLSQSDVTWIEKCHPKAAVGGIAVDGRHVTMCDIFDKKLWPDYNFLSNNNRQRMGGYVLAHEWGHYYYALYDEYVGDGKYNHLIYQPHSTDKAVDNSIMNNTWKAYSIIWGDNFNWLNFSIAKYDTKKTAQYRVYGASAWDTLVRPVSDDPRDGERVSLPDRIYYPELVDVKPVGNQDAPIDLPGAARSALSIIWSNASTSSLATLALADFPYEVQLTSLLGQNISYPTPIVLLAFVHKDAPITDMNVQASVQLPDGSSEQITFTDDGVAPDAVEGDGLYSAILGYLENGVYKISIEFDNSDGMAKFVYTSFAPAMAEEGPVPIQEPVPITENFTASKSIQVSISNVVSDDHGNTPEESTVIAANNSSVPGKIDYTGDRDVFQITTLSSGATYVRVDNLALGLNPRIRVIGSDMSTILFDANLGSSLGNYLYIPLSNVLPNTVVYVEISDLSNMALGGLYEFSAGQGLASDRPNSSLYLPTVIR
jgi:hypothetical protein